MNTTTIKEVIQFVKDNDIKFIKLAFCDLFGAQKNISIMPDELPLAFSEGISFDASAIKGFSDVINSDMFLHPDPTTLAVLPWRPQQGRVARFYCNIKNPDKTEFGCDSRSILKKVVNKCEKLGYVCKVGTECEFYLFKTDTDGSPTMIPYDNGGYLDMPPLDKGENIRREICIMLEDMGLKPESSHHEQGPGQNEIDFEFSDAMLSADNIMTFKSAVKATASRNGLYASFLPKPFADKPGNGMHINLSLSQNGYNIFNNGRIEYNQIADSFIAGILAYAPEMTLFLNPLCNSYERLGNCEAPGYVSWSHQNRSQLVRIPAASGEKVRMELRSPDPSANPYLALALIINAGLEGIENSLKLPEPINQNLYELEIAAKNIKKLPQNMQDAINTAKSSKFVLDTLGKEALDKYIACKEEEEQEYQIVKDKEHFWKEKYFSKI